MADDTNANGAMPAAQATEATTFDYDRWLSEQPAHVKDGLAAHTAGLHSALESERSQRKDERRDFARQLKEATAKAEKGSEAEKTLGEMSSRLEQAEQRASFYEEAGRPEIGCTNPKAAYLIAAADSLFNKRGDPDWPAIKQAAPELFGRKTPPGNAGSGSGNPPPSGANMNELIRRAAGRR